MWQGIWKVEFTFSKIMGFLVLIASVIEDAFIVDDGNASTFRYALPFVAIMIGIKQVNDARREIAKLKTDIESK